MSRPPLPKLPKPEQTPNQEFWSRVNKDIKMHNPNNQQGGTRLITSDENREIV
jgi:hypothetical protein